MHQTFPPTERILILTQWVMGPLWTRLSQCDRSTAWIVWKVFEGNLSNIHPSPSCCIKIFMQKAKAWAFGFKHTPMGIFRHFRAAPQLGGDSKRGNFWKQPAPPNKSYVSMHAQQFGLNLKSGRSKMPSQYRPGQAEFIQSGSYRHDLGQRGVSHSFERR